MDDDVVVKPERWLDIPQRVEDGGSKLAMRPFAFSEIEAEAKDKEAKKEKAPILIACCLADRKARAIEARTGKEVHEIDSTRSKGFKMEHVNVFSVSKEAKLLACLTNEQRGGTKAREDGTKVRYCNNIGQFVQSASGALEIDRPDDKDEDEVHEKSTAKEKWEDLTEKLRQPVTGKKEKAVHLCVAPIAENGLIAVGCESGHVFLFDRDGKPVNQKDESVEDIQTQLQPGVQSPVALPITVDPAADQAQPLVCRALNIQHQFPILDMCFSPKGDYLVTGSDNVPGNDPFRVLLWATRAGAEPCWGKVHIERFPEPDARTLKALALSSPFFQNQKDSEMLAIASGESVRVGLISTLQDNIDSNMGGDEGDKEGAKGVLKLGGEALAMAFSPRCACH